MECARAHQAMEELGEPEIRQRARAAELEDRGHQAKTLKPDYTGRASQRRSCGSVRVPPM